MVGSATEQELFFGTNVAPLLSAVGKLRGFYSLRKAARSAVHYLEITLFVKPRKPVGHFPSTAAASVCAPRRCSGEAHCDEEEDEGEEEEVDVHAVARRTSLADLRRSSVPAQLNLGCKNLHEQGITIHLITFIHLSY